MFKKLLLLSVVLGVAFARDYVQYVQKDCLGSDIRQESTHDVFIIMNFDDIAWRTHENLW